MKAVVVVAGMAAAVTVAMVAATAAVMATEMVAAEAVVESRAMAVAATTVVLLRLRQRRLRLHASYACILMASMPASTSG